MKLVNKYYAVSLIIFWYVLCEFLGDSVSFWEILGRCARLYEFLRAKVSTVSRFAVSSAILSNLCSHQPSHPSSKNMVVLELPESYGYVMLFCGVLPTVTNMVLSVPVMKARKELNVKYPNLYATPGYHKNVCIPSFSGWRGSKIVYV